MLLPAVENRVDGLANICFSIAGVDEGVDAADGILGGLLLLLSLSAAGGAPVPLAKTHIENDADTVMDCLFQGSLLVLLLHGG